MRKKLVFMVVFLFGLMACGVAGADAIDGFLWNDSTGLTKTAYVRGYTDGYLRVATMARTSGSTVNYYEIIRDALSAQPDLKWWVETIDKLYQLEGKRYYSVPVDLMTLLAMSMAKNSLSVYDDKVKETLESFLMAGR